MKRPAIIAGSAVAGFVGLLAVINPQLTSALELSDKASDQNSESTSPTPSETSTSASPTPSESSSSSDSANTTEEVITGDAFDVYYSEHGQSRYSGQVQVALHVSNGVVTEIEWLTYPQGEHLRYAELAYQYSSVPLEGMTIEEIKNASVETRTGATATSESFVSSLESALQQL